MPNCPYCKHELTNIEVGSLYGKLGGRSSSPLSEKDIAKIRKSKTPIKKLAQKYDVSFSTIWRVKENKTWASEMNCPHCGHRLSKREIGILFATVGSHTPSPLKVKRSILGGRSNSKLTREDVVNIRKSQLTSRELAEKYGVSYSVMYKIKTNRTWTKPLE